MEIDDFPADREAEPEAAVFVAAILGREIRRQNAAEVLLRNAFAMIDDPHAQPVAVRLRPGEPVELHPDLRTRRRSVDGVGNEVGDQSLDEHLVHLDEHFARAYR